MSIENPVSTCGQKSWYGSKQKLYRGLKCYILNITGWYSDQVFFNKKKKKQHTIPQEENLKTKKLLT